MARHYLYEAANCLLTTWGGRSPLKSWGLKLAKRVGAKKARVAVARKLACLLLRLWKDGTHYDEKAWQMIREENTFGLKGSNRWDECGTVGCKWIWVNWLAFNTSPGSIAERPGCWRSPRADAEENHDPHAAIHKAVLT